MAVILTMCSSFVACHLHSYSQDWTTNPGHIRFAWVLGNEATKTVGTLKFAVRFYSVDQQEKIFTYSL